MGDTEFDRALDACYEAVVAPETWPQALHRLALSVDASAAMILPEEIDPAVPMPASLEYEAFLPEYIAGNWFENHYRAIRGWPLVAKQTVVVEHELATDEERRKLAHYNELYLRWGYPGFAAVGFRVGERNYCVPFLRNARQGFFSKADAFDLAPISGHFRRILHLSEQFSATRLRGGLDVLEQIRYAALIVDGQGTVEAANPQAEALVRTGGEGLFVKAGRIAAHHPRSNAALQALIARCCGRDVGASGTVNVSPIRIERSERRPLVVNAVTLRAVVNTISPKASAILLISDLKPSPISDHAKVRELFDLTPSEARLAAALKSGDSLQTAAEKLSISYQTARTHLKAVFSKTGTRRQGELVALLASMVEIFL